MRISKLFHWLYAFLMMLPIFAIGSKVLYVTINQNAKDSYYGQTINQETNVFVSVNDLNNYYTYYFHADSSSLFNTQQTDLYIDNLILVDNGNLGSGDINNLQNNSKWRLIFYELDNLQRVEFNVYNSSTNSYNYLFWTPLNTYFYTISFTLDNVSVGSYNLSNTFYWIEYNDYSFIDNAFYYAVGQVKNEPLFSWVNTSVVYTPITYGSSLFGVPSDSVINTYLAYWLNVSIIWLMFDVLIYVPLLAHRWLDKGIRE